MDIKLRMSNPYNELVSQSTICFETPELTNAEEYIRSLYQNSLFQNAFFKKNAKTEIVDNRVLFFISHKYLDAFGISFLVAKSNIDKYILDAKVVAQPPRFRQILDSEYCYYHKAGINIASTNRTYTQIMICNLIKNHPGLKNEKIGLVVCIESVNDLIEEQIWGNSLVTISMNGYELLDYAENLTKKEWRRAIALRAKKTFNIIGRLKQKIIENPFDSILISSFGNINKYYWYQKIRTNSVSFFSTPAYNNFAHLIFWSNGMSQNMCFVRRGKHQITNDSISKIWQEKLI